MKLVKHLLYTFVVLAAGGRSFATTFIVPDDAELVQKSDAIVIGVVVAARSAEVEAGSIETFYEIALDQVLKGPFEPRTTVEIRSPGGMVDGRFTIVESAAHFRIGDEVLLFLTPHRGGWTPTDLTLGKFRFDVTSGGYSVVVRDAEDIAGWDRDGKGHREKIRLDTEFIQFIRETVAGRTPVVRNYEAEADDVLAPPPAQARNILRPVPDLFPAPATTYSVSIYTCDLTRYPARWEEMPTGVSFRKNSAQNASGLGDGGVSIIQNAVNAWTNDCGSSVNISYAGTTANLKNGGDGVNVIVFNDPGNDVPGTFQSSGVIALTFSSGGDTHQFDNTEFASFTDSDIVFQNGYAGTAVSIEEAMTHEIGHAIGFRHADRHYLQSCTVSACFPTCTESACQSGVEDCSSNAIMTATVNSTLGFTLQTWDMNAADALYPGTCVAVLPPTGVVATATSTSNVNVSWTASAGAVTYNIYRSADALTYSLAGSTTGPTVTFNDAGRSANTAYLYKVRAVNGGESGDSNRDLATTVIFTDDPLVAGTTLVKGAHITELRTAVNAVRTLAGLGAGSYTDPTLTVEVTPVKAVHINDLRTALDAARSALTLSALSYGETVTAGTTPVKTTHVSELRNGVK
jgi:hypothetical protein